MKKRIQNPKVNNKNWQYLFDTQFENLQQQARISKIWINGLSKLGLDNSKVPTAKELNRVSKKYTGWKFIQTKDTEIATSDDWYRLIIKKQMPLTNFVRTPQELYYCDEPDKWHDIIGHIPFLLDEEYSSMYVQMAKLYFEMVKANNDNYSMFAYIIELGIIRENNSQKAFGATLYSSAGELENAFKPGNAEEFNLEKVLAAGKYNRKKLSEKYYVIDSIAQINQLMNKFRKKYLDGSN